MTGFAIKTMLLTTPNKGRTHVTMSLKSLNSRFFEVVCKLPSAFSFLETDFIKLFKKKLHRGHVIFIVQLENSNVFRQSVQPDIKLVDSYLDALKQIKRETAISGDVTVSDILTLSNIFISEETGLDETTKQKIIEEVEALVDQLVQERLREGNELLKDLQQRIIVITKEMTQIEKEAEVLMHKRKEEITAKLNELEKFPPEVKESQRAALFLELDKIDIHEEVTRFKNHLQNFVRNLVTNEIEKGRRLDFILQELSREINTIAAKCSDSAISSHAINIKVELEKAREQVQNIV